VDRTDRNNAFNPGLWLRGGKRRRQEEAAG
jgi:hypothetical protein